jgi:hypothetical protein
MEGQTMMYTLSRRFALLLFHGLLLIWPGLCATAEDASDCSTFCVVSRSICQERGAGQIWKIDYQLRNGGKSPLVIAPANLSAKIDGWVSNSRVASHAMPRHSIMTVSGTAGLTAFADVIASTDEDQRCRERAILQIWLAETGDEPPDAISKATTRPVPPELQPTVVVAPAGILRLRLRLEHMHFLYGPHDALLGPRNVQLKLGSAIVRDLLPLDRERRRSTSCATEFPAPPADRMDHYVYHSAPDSLHLEAHVPGNQSYRFERPVRYGSRIRLRYWYLVASGTEGECKAQVRQFKDASIWRELPDGSHEQTLCTVGRWTRVERVFRTEAEATTLALEFRILGSSDIGEVWIDDITLDVLGDESSAP